ncbi:translation initiation factor Sui1 [Marinospirillum alkaliphilum]|uniref:Translation initiation factor 1 n=1 Tax=Marinospirillum alkaliphilum DSM 21637 TaxID=1122209 RepID=A0A1K1Y4J5_9GAMM|nr:translation initiation factor Sui1 [Marinospirillum alkaliphilum]SFX56172.1 translation initiation factor 1 [Marinospirillum alkaliphilum DSM 21637]
MASLQQQLSRLVYSTEQGQLCPACREALDACRCDDLADEARLATLDGVVRIRRETAGRKGKGVTTISGIPLKREALKQLAAELKKRCGTGGALKDDVIEIQGDQRETLKALLESKGFRVKLSGG